MKTLHVHPDRIRRTLTPTTAAIMLTTAAIMLGPYGEIGDLARREMQSRSRFYAQRKIYGRLTE
jgi:hypothetical protein